MTVNELIKHLELVKSENEARGELDIYIYIQGTNIPVEEPIEIDSVDDSISDRIDINIIII